MRELVYPPKRVEDPEHTRSKIILEGERMFALQGYHSVSIRDIGSAIGINPATIYFHFSSKLEIMESIMRLSEEGLWAFYAMLDQRSEEVESFSQLLATVFMESQGMSNPLAYYDIYCAMTNQFEIECCRHVYYDIYFQEGHRVLRRQLETAIRRGLVHPFNVGELATLMTNCFITMISFAVGSFNGFYRDFDPSGWYQEQIRHILRFTGAEQMG